MKERFPETDWWCDKCGDYLNSQDGFDDHKYIWKCTQCGFKSSISKDNIYDEDEIENNTNDAVSSVIDDFISFFKKN